MCLAAASGDLGADKLVERKWPFKGPLAVGGLSDKKILPVPLKRIFSLPKSFSAREPVPAPDF